ncbi:hypothetical protein ACFO25_15450 [Paenactinomyces guangxiensis]|uniref:Uncharacterized protein n=1 Tax=Paenactinomyces guangxiensis TaxID=1490290 RepID=A0A7W1WT79_9BACL|nr:hypothetical protein [Paenactinomyces guangxiensis]MBA4495569.1 hypothetical protein [Paenactinomyces guangxiensis]MBH8592827.1 hypothetical protein [Paenactinomyces guangxiensis]
MPMEVPFAARAGKPSVPAKHLPDAFIFLNPVKGKPIIFRFANVEVKTENDKTVVSGRCIDWRGNKGGRLWSGTRR